MNMKKRDFLKTTLTIVFIIVCNLSPSQNVVHVSTSSVTIIEGINNQQIISSNTYKKGYIGISSEISLLIGVTSVGFRINIDSGYKISKVFGIEGLVFGGEYNIKNYDGTGPYRMNINTEIETWKYRGFLAGPLFSIPIGEKAYWNISPMIGHSWGYPEYYYSSKYSTVTYDLNTNLFFHTDHRMAFRVTTDCLLNDEILTVNLGLGLICRLNK
jgi:hypothetical protein